MIFLRLIFLSAITILSVSNSLSQSYSFKSWHLQNPDRMIPYVDSCITFWKKSFDETTGSFYTNVDRKGARITSQPANKDMLTQSRNAYAFIRHFQLTGDSTSLTYARRALQFILDNSWDKTYGGWINSLNQNGVPTNKQETKTAFFQHYALLGFAAMYEATGDTAILNRLLQGWQFLEDHFWDTRSGFEGYYDNMTYNRSVKKGKSFNSHIDAITTHLLMLNLQFPDSIKYSDKMVTISDLAINRLIGSMLNQAIGFCEEFSSDWKEDPAENLSIMGHVLKTSWCLGRQYQLNKQDKWKQNAILLTDHVLEKGYDHQYGGPYKDYNRFTGDMMMWGNPDTAKAWWQMQQAVMAGFMLYDLTMDEKYLEMADETLTFFMRWFVDHTYGELYSDTKRSGPLTWGDQKGNGYKAGYHSVETGYYSYLYSNAYAKDGTFKLAYRISPTWNSAGVMLNPIALPAGELAIDSIHYEGSGAIQLDESLKKLTATPDANGVATVFFKRNRIPVSVAESELTPEQFFVSPAYPNPFNPSTSIMVTGLKSAPVVLTVYDLLGRIMMTETIYPDSRKSIQVNLKAGKTWASGVYFARLSNEGRSQVVRVLLQK